MAEQHQTEHETDDIFMLGDLKKRFDGVDVGFIPFHLRPRLSFEVASQVSGYTFYTQDAVLTAISVFFDGWYIGGICVESAWGDICRTWNHNPMPHRWSADKTSTEGIKFSFKDNDGMYHPTFHSLSDMLLYHFSQGA